MAGVCLVLTGPRLADCQGQLDENRPHIDMAELRADLVDPADWADLNEFSRGAGVPLILTLRQPADGGRWVGTEDARRSFFRMALNGEWRWLDIEDDQRLPDIEAEWAARGRKLIVSFHEFKNVPEGWADRLRTNGGPGIIPKAAVYPQNSRELLRFLQELTALPPGDRVVLGMGPYGFPTRILAARLGSLWTYASPAGQTAAPGQIDPETLQSVYRFRLQTPTSPVYGIVGNPVFHSKSPRIHNPGLTRLDLPGTYLPFLADDLETFFAAGELLGIRGLSCTIPFKEAVVKYLTEQTASVEGIGACNTLWKEADGSWKGDNTDAPGFLAPLAERIGGDFSGMRATVVGTGGAARGIVWGLRQQGVKVLILGRSPEKAAALARDFDSEWAPLAPESLALVQDHADLIVQTTSVGMGDSAGEDPLPWYPFTGKEIAYEVIYVPRWTVFLTRAKEAGCGLLFGEDMLVNQAFGQFRHFTGQGYPIEALNL